MKNQIITIDNFKDFHDRLIGLGFTHVILESLKWEDYFILLRDNGKTRFRLGISIHNDPDFDKSIALTVCKHRILPNGKLKACGKYITIEDEIPLDKVIELKEMYS